MESLKRLLKQAGAMQRSRVVELVSGRVRELLTASQDWEGEARAALKQKSVETIGSGSPAIQFAQCAVIDPLNWFCYTWPSLRERIYYVLWPPCTHVHHSH